MQRTRGAGESPETFTCKHNVQGCDMGAWNRGAPRVAGDTCKHNVQGCDMGAWNRGAFIPPWGVATCRGFAMVEILMAALLGSAVVGGTFKVLEVSMQSSRVAKSTLTEQELTVLVGNVLNNDDLTVTTNDCHQNLKTSSTDFTKLSGSGVNEIWRLSKLKKNVGASDEVTLLQTGQDFQNNLEIIDMQLTDGGSLNRRFVVFYKKKNMGDMNTLGGGSNCDSTSQEDCYYAYCDLKYDPVPPSGTPSKCGEPSCVYFNAAGGGNEAANCYKVTDNSGSPRGASLIGCNDTDKLNQNNLVAIGYGAGKSTNRGNAVFIGYWAGRNNRGSHSTFVGYRAGYDNNGGDNTFFGDSAGSSNSGGGNTFIGSSAGYSLSGNSGSDNVFVGYKTGYDNTSGDNNIFIGQYDSGDDTNTTGSDNIFIGRKTGKDNEAGISATADRQLNIGNLIFGKMPSTPPAAGVDFFSSSYLGSNEGTIINGNLYIASSGMPDTLQVCNTGGTCTDVKLETGLSTTIAAGPGIVINGNLYVATSGGAADDLKSCAGGTTCTNAKLSSIEPGDILSNNRTLIASALQPSINSAFLNIVSSQEYKKNITPFTDYDRGLQDILKTPLFNYEYKDHYPEKQRMGFISEKLPQHLQIIDEDQPSKPDMPSIYGAVFAAIKALHHNLISFKESMLKEIRQIKQWLNESLKQKQVHTQQALQRMQQQLSHTQQALKETQAELKEVKDQLKDLKQNK